MMNHNNPTTNQTYFVSEHSFDVIIVGGGVAGLSAALTLARARRSVLVVDAGRPRNAPAAHSHGYLTRDGVAPLALPALGRQEVEHYGGTVIQGEVTAIEPAASAGFQVTLADQTRARARRVLVTTGLVDQLPAIPGLHERWGQDVVHCPYCFGWELRDAPLGVLATTAHAPAQALLWRQWSADLTLFLHTAPEPTSGELAQLAARGIRVVRGTVSAIEVTDDRLSGVRLESGVVIPRRALAVAPRYQARHALLESLGVVIAEHPRGIGSQVQADATGRTAAPGIWVAGNVAEVSASVSQAAASGFTAATAINADLVAEDTARAMVAVAV